MAGDSATITLKGENKQLNKTLKDSESSVKKFGSGVKKVFVAMAAFVAGAVVFAAFKKFIDAAEVQEKAERKLAGVIRATGNASELTAKQMIKQAAALQEITTFGDEAIINAQAILATFKNIKGDQFREATAAMVDMAAVMDTDVKSGAVQLGKALNDPIKGAAALARVGVTFTDQQKKVIKAFQDSGQMAKAQGVILDELKGQFGGVAAEMAKTAGGQLKQFQNRMGDLQEVIGKKLAPVMLNMLPIIENVANFFVDKVVPAIEATIEVMGTFIKGIKEDLQPAFEFLMEAGLNTFTAIQTVIVDFKNVSLLAFKSVQLSFVRAFNVIVHFLTVIIPAAVVFFRDNFVNMLEDLANITTTVLTNLGENFTNFFSELGSAVTGGGFDFEFTGLTKGFESSMGEFPEIAARVKGDLEKALEVDIQNLAQGVVAGFDKKLKENRKVLNEIIEAFDDEVVKDEDHHAQDILFAAVVPPPEEKDFKASIEGLTALNKRITTAAASRKKDDPADKIVQPIMQIAKQGKEQLDKEDKVIAAVVDGNKKAEDIGNQQVQLTKEFLDKQGLQ